ncbi:unnamed protein product, partial [Hapterophycus canaliculatus]
IRRNKGRWTSEEHAAFLHGLRLFQRDNWAAVASVVPTRTVLQVRTHAQKYFNKVDKGEEFPEEVRMEGRPEISGTVYRNSSAVM